MATTEANMDMALNVQSNASLTVVDELSPKPATTGPGKGALSAKLNRKSNLKVPRDKQGQPRPFGTNIEPPLVHSPSASTTWADSSASVNPHMIAPGTEGYMELTHTTPLEGTSIGFSAPLENTESGNGFFQTIADHQSLDTMSDDTLGSDSFQETFSTPQFQPTSCNRDSFLKDPPESSLQFVIGTPPAPKEETSGARRKRRSMARHTESGSKQKKGSQGNGAVHTPQPKPKLKKGEHKLFANFYRTRSSPLVPDSPFSSSVGKASYQGEVPPTPSRLLPPTANINVQLHMQYILSTRKVDADTADCLMDFAGLLDQLLGTLRQELAVGQPERAQPPVFSGPRATPAPFPVSTPLQGIEPLPSAAIPQPSLGQNPPPPSTWATVTAKKKSSLAKSLAPKVTGPVQRSAAPPTPVVSLPSRPSLPVVLVHPLGDPPVAVPVLKSKLESSISPHQLGVKVIACQPAAGNGLLIRTETAEMAQTITSAINSHGELSGICRAREPSKRVPQILVYDVPPTSDTRDLEEARFIEKLRSSNDLPEGDIRVLFRKKGRGSSHHWVLSMAPAVFRHLPARGRLHWGFGSLKFREFFEPTRCYKCHRFGHVRQNCTVQQDLCSRCPGEHNFKDCPRDTPVCRRCREYNTRNRNGPRVSIYHSALSERCPIYLRECEALRTNTHYAT
ncbi:hypothetical protein AVEN_118322-1 [Araneus ventricosus]|uniref:CCHC-type domain-containing protein n=1 Tax=Araneus ventricosus TaxID=182803 RepID=A0A4Y2B5T8_ARAVE|nr:hypothetical protein AVEN_118322-1 [Araneus ventricosus]